MSKKARWVDITDNSPDGVVSEYQYNNVELGYVVEDIEQAGDRFTGCVTIADKEDIIKCAGVPHDPTTPARYRLVKWVPLKVAKQVVEDFWKSKWVKKN